MTFAWPRIPLDDDSRRAIEAAHWKRFSATSIVAVAEAWNAGVTTAQMAPDMRCSPASLRILIGRLTQLGVKLRKAGQAAPKHPQSAALDFPPEEVRQAPQAPRRFSWEPTA